MSPPGFCHDESEPLVGRAQPSKSKTRKRGREPLSSSSATSPNANNVQTQQFNDQKTIAVNASRLKAAHTRSSSLSCLSIFTLLSLHTLEHHIVDSLYLPTREAFLAIFVHNALAKCQSILSTGQQKPIPEESGASSAPPVAPSKFTRLTTTTGNTSYIAAPPQLWTKHNEKIIDARKLARWLKDTVRIYAKLLKIPETPTLTRMVRSLEYHLVTKGKPCQHIPARQIWPLVTNPQPAKRHIVTVSQLLQTDILNPPNPQDVRDGTVMGGDSGVSNPTFHDKLVRFARSSTFRRSSDPPLTPLPEYAFASFLLDTLTTESLIDFTDLESAKDKWKPRDREMIADMAERIANLPYSLISRLISLEVNHAHPSFPIQSNDTRGPPLSDRSGNFDSENSELPESRSCPNLDTAVGRSEFALDVLKRIPIHLIVLWETIASLLLQGTWDVVLEEVLRNCALSLDLCPDSFDLLVAFTADLVAETGSKMQDNLSPSTAQEIPTSSEIRTLATTSTNTLCKRKISRSRIMKITGVAIGVGALSALTAGLAAPAFAAGVGALGITGASGFVAFLGTTGGSATLASLFGASSASLSGWKFSRRLADIRVFKFEHITSVYVIDAISSYISNVMEKSEPSLSTTLPRPSQIQAAAASTTKHAPPFRISIGISGWLRTIEDATAPWTSLDQSLGSELFALIWEPHLLTALGAMMYRMIGEQFASSAASLWIQMTMTAGTGFILWPVSLLQYAGRLDNTWMTCRERAQQAGTLLAQAISDKSLVGNRPVTLVGYSMGARVISFALRSLYDQGEFNRVQHAVLMGLPGSKTKENWRKMRSVVSGRLVNVYCSSDWILGFLYRWMEWGIQVAGLSPIEGVEGVENFDATGIVISHAHYEKKLPDLLSYIGFHASSAQTNDLVPSQ